MYKNKRSFFLEYIVYELEIVCAKLKADKHLVPTTLVSMNIPFEKLVTVYNKYVFVSCALPNVYPFFSFSSLITISVNDHFLQMEENEFHLSEATAALIDCFIGSHESYNSVEK